MAVELDAIDAKILDLIQRDAALSVAEIAEKVGLSSSPCWRRIKRMEEQGIIARRVESAHIGHRLVRIPQHAGFVWQTDAGELAALALGAVVEGRDELNGGAQVCQIGF
jgi:DNA-binding IclR family transcriptional regulator